MGSRRGPLDRNTMLLFHGIISSMFRSEQRHDNKMPALLQALLSSVIWLFFWRGKRRGRDEGYRTAFVSTRGAEGDRAGVEPEKR